MLLKAKRDDASEQARSTDVDALRSARDAVADELREETTRAALAKADADERLEDERHREGR